MKFSQSKRMILRLRNPLLQTKPSVGTSPSLPHNIFQKTPIFFFWYGSKKNRTQVAKFFSVPETCAPTTHPSELKPLVPPPSPCNPFPSQDILENRYFQLLAAPQPLSTPRSNKPAPVGNPVHPNLVTPPHPHRIFENIFKFLVRFFPCHENAALANLSMVSSFIYTFCCCLVHYSDCWFFFFNMIPMAVPWIAAVKKIDDICKELFFLQFSLSTDPGQLTMRFTSKCNYSFCCNLRNALKFGHALECGKEPKLSNFFL